MKFISNSYTLDIWSVVRLFKMKGCNAVYYIYKIQHIKNKKKYIGLTSNWKRRYLQHFGALSNNKHHNSFLQKEYNRDGVKSFSFEVLAEGILESEISQVERDFIKKYDSYENGYNQNIGGDFKATNGGSVLIKDEIFQICSVLEFGNGKSGQVLGDVFDVSRTTISRIKRRVSHDKITREYESLTVKERQKMYDLFDTLEKIALRSNNKESTRKLTKEQLFYLLSSREFTTKTKESLKQDLGLSSTFIIYLIENGKTYVDWKDEYDELTTEQKKASLLRN